MHKVALDKPTIPVAGAIGHVWGHRKESIARLRAIVEVGTKYSTINSLEESCLPALIEEVSKKCVN